MWQNYPGFLYAKSLSSGEPLGQGYRTWFFNPALKPYGEHIESLRDSFRWRTDSSKRHSPVVVLEPVGEGNSVLVIRFNDAGKDTFGRPQTLRMEAFLVPAGNAAGFWDGSFSAKPDAASAEFQVKTESKGNGFPGLNGKRLVNGNSADFSLEGRIKPRENIPITTSDQAPDCTSVTQEQPSNPPSSCSGQSKVKKPFFIVLLALLVSIATNVWPFDSAATERKELQSRLSQAEKQLENIHIQMQGFEKERAALATFKRQSNAFAEALEDLQRITDRLDCIRKDMSSSANTTSGFEFMEEN